MSLAERKLDIAIDVLGRAMRSSPDASADEWIRGLDVMLARVDDLDAGPPDWTEATLEAASEITRQIWRDGGPVDDVTETFERVHAAVVRLARPPRPETRVRNRRDN